MLAYKARVILKTPQARDMFSHNIVKAQITCKGVRLKNAVVLEGVTIGANSWINNSIIGLKSKVGRWVRIQNVSVLGEDVHVADEIFINGGRILHHKEITNSIMEESIVM